MKIEKVLKTFWIGRIRAFTLRLWFGSFQKYKWTYFSLALIGLQPNAYSGHYNLFKVSWKDLNFSKFLGKQAKNFNVNLLILEQRECIEFKVCEMAVF